MRRLLVGMLLVGAIGCVDERDSRREPDSGTEEDPCPSGAICLQDSGTSSGRQPYDRCTPGERCAQGTCTDIGGISICTSACFEEDDCPYVSPYGPICVPRGSDGLCHEGCGYDEDCEIGLVCRSTERGYACIPGTP
jgi:hypothetical protein